MTTVPTPPKPADEPEGPAPTAPGEDSTNKKAKASWFTFRRTMVVGGALSAAWGAAVLAGRKWAGAYSANRDRLDRAIVIVPIGHRDHGRSEATLVRQVVEVSAWRFLPAFDGSGPSA